MEKKMSTVKDLIGHTMSDVVMNDNKSELVFTSIYGKKYKLYHSQDCCESVFIEEIWGDLKNLIGEPILYAEEVTNRETPVGDRCNDSYTWTFYKFATIKGWVDIRWLGESNGYYSESVDFEEIK